MHPARPRPTSVPCSRRRPSGGRPPWSTFSTTPRRSCPSSAGCGARAAASRGRLRGGARPAGGGAGPDHGRPHRPRARAGTEPPRLQATWSNGELVVWVGGPTGDPVGLDELGAWLAEAEAPTSGWEPHAGVPVPGADRAPALSAPLRGVLGWLAHVRREDDVPDLGASVRWIAELVSWAVELVAQGRMVPQLSYRAPNRAGNDKAGGNDPVEGGGEMGASPGRRQAAGRFRRALARCRHRLEGHPEPREFTRGVLTRSSTPSAGRARAARATGAASGTHRVPPRWPKPSSRGSTAAASGPPSAWPPS